jgi:hypothetical protein
MINIMHTTDTHSKSMQLLYRLTNPTAFKEPDYSSRTPAVVLHWSCTFQHSHSISPRDTQYCSPHTQPTSSLKVSLLNITVPHICCAFPTSHSPSFNNSRISGEELKLGTFLPSLFLCHLVLPSSFDPYILLNALFSNILNQFSCLTTINFHAHINNR